jgi:hypothetical protein
MRERAHNKEVSHPFTDMLPHLLTLALALAPSLASAALYPKDSMVKMIDTRGFRNALKENVCGTTYLTLS